jgi:hypothetical protein
MCVMYKVKSLNKKKEKKEENYFKGQKLNTNKQIKKQVKFFKNKIILFNRLLPFII